VAQTVTLLCGLIEEHKMTVVIPGALPIVMGDETALRHVVQNLLANSVRYQAPDRLPIVTITATTGDGRGRLTIADNGLGIPPERRESVFLPGLRFAPGPGNGLGLAAARSLVERHGGRIWSEGNPSSDGVRFVVDLPLAGDDGPSQPAAATASPPATLRRA
jgi:signal transduction histidine kinase